MNFRDNLPAEDKEILSRTCPVCHKIYSGKSQLYRHLREIHNEYEKYQHTVGNKAQHTFKCLEGCDYSTRLNRDLRDHLIHFHEFDIKEKKREFHSLEAFNKWFTELQEMGACFIRHQGRDMKKRKNGSKVTYYSCNRSGVQRIKSAERKRKEKKHGSRKINAGCTCFLKLMEFKDKFIVTYCDFHYGHKIELEHLPLPFRARAEIMEKLEKGAQIVKIKLQNDGSYVGLSNVQRSSILTSADLKSLKYYYKQKKKMPFSKMVTNVKVIEPETDIPLTVTENNQFEIITIISNDNSDCQSWQTEQLTSELLSEDIQEQMEVTAENDNEYVKGIPGDNTYGHYVNEMLEKINADDRALAKREIDAILKRFISKSKKLSM